MATIAENLQTIKDSTDDIRQAILDKGEQLTGGIVTYADAISNLLPRESDVMFYDYDGTLLHSYTKDKFLTLTSLPELPSQPGLICQGWNWTLEDAKTYVQEYGKLNIGATYITDDGKTRLYINLLNTNMTVPLQICWADYVEGNEVIIEWGDGNSKIVSGMINGSFNHTYENPGSYIISLKVNSGICELGLNNQGCNVIGFRDSITSGFLYKVEIGTNISVSNAAFDGCCSLQSITIPNSVTTIGEVAFYYCCLLQSITIPNSVNMIGNTAFGRLHSLQSITLPNSVNMIDGSAFADCYSLQSITLPNSITSIQSYTFSGCYSLQNITIPNSITSIGDGAFGYCPSLQSITLPNSITSIQSVFSDCRALQSIIIPNSVTTIANWAFSSCYNIQYYDFTSHTSIPTLSGNNAFERQDGCEIRVPTALYESWKSATNWSNYADYIVTG